ncbi:hypothetical protein AVEN_172172-1 [Araneus ventricosus]|uniref:Integrase catalytic domain-containing protein n=1 Tax=Araneus ventricosus TaxID=182803 RepID=A0A4Y2JIU9_ARAVE|nr:hypothetical protein AVEN_172172-1 [Araneus ventricosus]
MALDILGPLPVTTKGNRYVLVLMDYFTKWPEAIPIPDQEASTVADELVRAWISRYGVPMILHSDQEARLESVHAFARERIKLASERMKTRYDSGATGHHFKEGDQVWMYNPKRRRGLSPKLEQNWEGPYTIVKKLNDVIYRVQRSPNAKPKVIHINRLTPYRGTDHSSV